MSRSKQHTSLPPEGEGNEAAAVSLSQRLICMKGQTPSISAVALRGDSKVDKYFIYI